MTTLRTKINSKRGSYAMRLLQGLRLLKHGEFVTLRRACGFILP